MNSGYRFWNSEKSCRFKIINSYFSKKCFNFKFYTKIPTLYRIENEVNMLKKSLWKNTERVRYVYTYITCKSSLALVDSDEYSLY